MYLSHRELILWYYSYFIIFFRFMTYFLHLITEMKNAALRYVHFQGSLGGEWHIFQWLNGCWLLSGDTLRGKYWKTVVDYMWWNCYVQESDNTPNPTENVTLHNKIFCGTPMTPYIVIKSFINKITIKERAMHSFFLQNLLVNRDCKLQNQLIKVNYWLC